MSSNRSECKPPRFTIVSPITGKAYMVAAHKWCLEDYAHIVPLFINGLAPIEMLEHELPLLRRTLLARKVGRYKDELGKVAEKSQTAVDFREELIATTLKNHKDFCHDDEDAELELLFPHVGIKSRDIKRANIDN